MTLGPAVVPLVRTEQKENEPPSKARSRGDAEGRQVKTPAQNQTKD